MKIDMTFPTDLGVDITKLLSLVPITSPLSEVRIPSLERPRLVVTFKEGNPSKYTVFYSSGTIQATWSVKDGLLDGPFREFSFNKVLLKDHFYILGKKHGVFTEYGKDGHILKYCCYDKDLQITNEYGYWFEGRLRYISSRLQSISDGPSIQFYKNGNIRSMIYYNDVINHTIEQTFDKTGILTGSSEYLEDKPLREESFKDGVCYTRFFQDGDTSTWMRYVNHFNDVYHRIQMVTTKEKKVLSSKGFLSWGELLFHIVLTKYGKHEWVTTEEYVNTFYQKRVKHWMIPSVDETRTRYERSDKDVVGAEIRLIEMKHQEMFESDLKKEIRRDLMYKLKKEEEDKEDEECKEDKEDKEEEECKEDSE